jgi:hypothetical protein
VRSAPATCPDSLGFGLGSTALTNTPIKAVTSCRAWMSL